MIKPELKPCPFCGGKAKMNITNDGTRNLFYAFCTECFTIRSTSRIEDEAAEAWNKRSTGWIPVKDRLPEEIHRIEYHDYVYGDTSFTESDFVICRIIYDGEIQYVTGFVTEGEWFLYHDMYNEENENLKVTHWMPLPELPEEKEISK